MGKTINHKKYILVPKSKMSVVTVCGYPQSECSQYSEYPQVIKKIFKLKGHPGDDSYNDPTLTKLTPHGTFRTIKIGAHYVEQIYDGYFDDWTTLPQSHISTYTRPSSQDALYYALSVRNQLYIDWMTQSKISKPVYKPLVDDIIQKGLVDPISIYNFFSEMYTPYRSEKDSIHIAINSHGEDSTNNIKFDNRVRMFFSTSHNTYAYNSYKLYKYIISLYRQRIPIQEIISLWKTECKKNYKLAFPNETDHFKSTRKETSEPSILNATKQIGSKICYESGVIKDRLYSFTQGYDQVIDINPNNLYGAYSGSIQLLKCTLNGKQVNDTELTDFLSDQPNTNHLLNSIRLHIRNFILNKTAYYQRGSKLVRSGTIHLSEILLLLNRFARIYIYDFACRGSNDDSIHPTVFFQKESHLIPLLKRPSYLNPDTYSESESTATSASEVNTEPILQRDIIHRQIELPIQDTEQDTEQDAEQDRIEELRARRMSYFTKNKMGRRYKIKTRKSRKRARCIYKR